MTRPVVDGDATMLRRFNPKDDTHCFVDQGTGERRFRSGALKFDAYPDEYMFEASCFNEDLLRSEGLTPADILEDPSWAIAAASADVIRAVTRSAQPPIFDVVGDPFPEGPTLLRDGAHALISHAEGCPKVAKTYSCLAREFRII